MNILFDATVFEFPFTGVAKSTLLLYEKCREIAPAINLNGFIRKEPYSELPSFIGLHKLQESFFSASYLQKTINQIAEIIKPDVVHFPWHGNVPCKFADAMTVMTLHDVLPLEIPDFFESGRQRMHYLNKMQNEIDLSDLIFTDSYYSKKQIEKNFHVKCRIMVNYLAPTLSKNKIGAYKEPDFQYFVYVGGYSSRKGLDSLLKAFLSIYENKKTKSKLLFTGTPIKISKDFQKLMNKGKELGVIEERGYVPDEELEYLIENSIALIYLSKYEGFGLPPLDAMNLGCPVITTRYSSLPEICGEAAIYVEPDDIEEVSEKMLLLERDSDARTELRQKGLIQASSFSWEKTANTFLNNISMQNP